MYVVDDGKCHVLGARSVDGEVFRRQSKRKFRVIHTKVCYARLILIQRVQ